jgi:hypothetical protein
MPTHAIAAAGAGFLAAVLWFDLIFDIQARGGGEVAAPAALASISAYYGRVTSRARPMGGLVQLVMLATVAAIVAGLVLRQGPWWSGGVSLAAAVVAIGLARIRTIPNARRLGAAADTPTEMTRLARQVLADHVVCLSGIAVVVALQVAT